MTKITIQNLFDSGVHLGHPKQNWHPNMAPYIFGIRNNIHIIDLEQTLPMLKQSLNLVREVAKRDGKILFLGTRPDIANFIAIAARRCNQPYMNRRWVNGTFTNWHEIHSSIQQFKYLDELKEHRTFYPTEQRKYKRLKNSYQGVKDLNQLPDLLFVIGTNQHKVAIKEANLFNIPVIGVVDSNCDPREVTFPIPGNDDSLRAVYLYCRLFSDTIIDACKT